MSAFHSQTSPAFASFPSVIADSGWTPGRANRETRSVSWVRHALAAASDALADAEMHEVIEGAALLAISGAATVLMLAVFGA
jgi:hypothetical protein